MSNITTAFQERSYLIPKADFASDSQAELIRVIMKRHGVSVVSKIKLIDENDDYDSFFVQTFDLSFCVKVSFDKTAIFYDYMVLKGIEHLNIAPLGIDRGEIEFGKTVYYTIQSYEWSENLQSIGQSSILEGSLLNGFNNALSTLHSFTPPTQVHEYIDDTTSYLENQRINFSNIMQYVSEQEESDFYEITSIYDKVFSEMQAYYRANRDKIDHKTLVHGNLDLSTIIANDGRLKFINLENAFLGCHFFDLVNMVFEMQMSGNKEYDFVTKRIKDLNLVDNRLSAAKYLDQYKTCKYIWTRKKFLDLIKDYVKEIIVLDKSRQDKILKLSHEFSNNFYRYNEIDVFREYKERFVGIFHSLVLA